MRDAVVVGAGVFGAWIAHSLHAGGYRVTLVEAHAPGHSRSSSGGESRIIRCGYGPDDLYSSLARRSLGAWQELSDRIGGSQPLFHRCGVLWLAPHEDAYVQATRRTLLDGGYPATLLDRGALRERYPHLAAAELESALLEPDCGVIMARRAVSALAADLESRGVRLVRARVTLPRADGPLRAVQTSDGEISGDLFVFACGAWLPSVFPDLLRGLIRPTRQVVLFFGTPPGDDAFGPERTPAWVDFPAGIYGVPDLEGRGLKIGIDRHGPAFDPDSGDRAVDDVSIAAARVWLERRFPAMAGAPLVESRVCQYENTATGDFLIDRHPQHANVIIAGGGSGHGFKHGPAIGEYVARLCSTGNAPHDRFGLAGKTAAARRQIY